MGTHRGISALALLLLAPLASIAQSQDAASLADVVRQKPAAHAEVVVTDDDLPKDATPAEKPAAAAEQVPAHEASDKPGAAAISITVKGLLENATLQRARAVLTSLEGDRQRLLERYAQIQTKLASEHDDSLRRLYLNSMSHRDETLAAKQQQIDSVRKAIEAAEAKL